MSDPRYLVDAEAPANTWTEPIEADGEESALQECNDRAKEYDVELVAVSHWRNNQYDCHFNGGTP